MLGGCGMDRWLEYLVSHTVKGVDSHVGSSGASFGKFIYFIVFQHICMFSNFLNTNFIGDGSDGLYNVSNKDFVG